ncbi:MAG: AsmA-like C-terminal region-containing protein [Pseudomonadota bacterium]
MIFFVLAAPIVLLLVAWVVLYSAVFNAARSQLAERVLSEEIGQPVVIDGTVRVSLGTTITVEMENASIPSIELPDMPLAELEHVSLRAQLGDILKGAGEFDGLVVSGLAVSLIQVDDGRNTWSTGETPEALNASAGREVGEAASDAVTRAFEAKTLLNFVLQRTERLSDVRWRVEDKKSGFVFDYELRDMTFERDLARETLRLASNGTLNGQPFTSQSAYNRDGPFFTDFEIGSLSLLFTGNIYPDRTDGGYDGRLTVKTPDVGDLLDVLKLDRAMEGEGELTADVAEQNGVVSVSNISIVMDLDEGRAFSATGAIGDFKALDDVDIALDFRFVPEDQAPPRADRFSEIRPLSASARIEGQGGDITIEDAILRTNAFTESVDEFGPVSVGRLQRTPDNKLALSRISLSAGPPDTPYITATGELLDALNLAQFAFEGAVSAPATLLLTEIEPEKAKAFGTVSGAFAFDDRDGFGRLRKFELGVVDTDLWAFQANAQSGEDPERQTGKLSYSLRVEDGADFFAALGLEPIDLSPLEVGMTAEGSLEALDFAMRFAAGGSDLEGDFSLAETERTLQLDGEIRSAALLLSDLEKLMQALEDISSLNDPSDPPDDIAAASTNQILVQPLLLPDDASATDGGLEALLAQDDVQPLILPELDDPKLADLFDPDSVLRYMDVDVAIEIAQLSGVKGVARISSELTASGGKAQLAPIRLKYGAGEIDAAVNMNVIDAPDRVQVSGRAGGWDLRDALALIGPRLDASGTLAGSFDLSGRYGSDTSFVDTMRGRATVRMSNGAVSTSLLELAGLGVFPWLFSEARREGRTEITCLVAPMQVEAGALSSDQVVLETRQVQVVTRGTVNWREDSINLRAEARPVGRPLARSAWPFDVSGKLSSPDFQLQAGGSRVRRADGANVMPEPRQPCVPDIAQLRSN